MKTTNTIQQKAKKIVDKNDFGGILQGYSCFDSAICDAIADEILSRYSINNLKKILEKLEDLQHLHLYKIIARKIEENENLKIW